MNDWINICRGIHNKFFYDSLKYGKLKTLMDITLADASLTVQIRNDYLNIYYKGGNVAKVTSPNSVDFSKYYFRNIGKKSDANVEILKQEKLVVIDLFKKGDYLNFIRKMKDTMETYWSNEPKGIEEKKEQHLLSLNNHYNLSDFTLIDLEYQVSTLAPFSYCGMREKKTPRFDMIAVRNRDGQLCIIELKKGIEAIYGRSGIEDHVDSYQNSILLNYKPFIDEMRLVLHQKQELGLIDVRLKLCSDKPEFIFAYSFDNKISNEKQRICFSNEQKDKKIEHYKVIWLKPEQYKLIENENNNS